MGLQQRFEKKCSPTEGVPKSNTEKTPKIQKRRSWLFKDYALDFTKVKRQLSFPFTDFLPHWIQNMFMSYEYCKLGTSPRKMFHSRLNAQNIFNKKYFN